MFLWVVYFCCIAIEVAIVGYGLVAHDYFNAMLAAFWVLTFVINGPNKVWGEWVSWKKFFRIK